MRLYQAIQFYVFCNWTSGYNILITYFFVTVKLILYIHLFNYNYNIIIQEIQLLEYRWQVHYSIVYYRLGYYCYYCLLQVTINYILISQSSRDLLLKFKIQLSIIFKGVYDILLLNFMLRLRLKELIWPQHVYYVYNSQMMVCVIYYFSI